MKFAVGTATIAWFIFACPGGVDARNFKKGVSFAGAQSCTVLEPHTDSSWWYSWSAKTGLSGTKSNFCDDGGTAVLNARDAGMDFVPTFWSSVPSQPFDSETDANLDAAKYLMTFNEPDRSDQANLTALQAATMWSEIVDVAISYDLEIVGPCMTKDAYQWYREFLSACNTLYGEDCRTEYTCIHTYYQPYPCPGLNDWECIGDATGHWLRNTIDKWTASEFGSKPLWVTEYGCYPWVTGGCDAAKHEAILDQQTAIFEEDSRVFRYNWFTTYAFDEGGFKDGALNVANWIESSNAKGCPNREWVTNVYPTFSWGIEEIHQCVAAAKANGNCWQSDATNPDRRLALSMDNDNCYCAIDACTTLVDTWGGMRTFFEVDPSTSDASSLTAIGQNYNDFIAATVSPTNQPTTPGTTDQPTLPAFTPLPTPEPSKTPTLNPTNAPTKVPTPAPEPTGTCSAGSPTPGKDCSVESDCSCSRRRLSEPAENSKAFGGGVRGLAKPACVVDDCRIACGECQGDANDERQCGCGRDPPEVCECVPTPAPTTPTPTPECDPQGTPCTGQCNSCCNDYTGSGNSKQCA